MLESTSGCNKFTEAPLSTGFDGYNGWKSMDEHPAADTTVLKIL